MTMDLNLLVGGEAGQGIQTVGFILGKSFVRAGWHVFADQDYESRIRGGHNFFRVRVSDRPVSAQTDDLDILIALNQQTLDLHRPNLKKNGIILLDCKTLKLEPENGNYADVPMQEIAEATGGKIMTNSVAVGAVLGLLGSDFEVLARVLSWHFSKNEIQIQEDNLKAARAGFEYASAHYPNLSSQKYPALNQGNRLFMTGNEAISLGAMAAGCKLVAGYPMTPITSILEFLAEKGRDYGIAFIQPEDEISAINMVVGAGYSGVRALTATSGSGFALMVEGIGLAGMTETPAVIVLGERPGPAIGLPTRTEQGELLFAIRGSTGEFPKVVLAPANIEEAFWMTIKAFNLSEKYQTPVIILTDTHLANSYTDIEKFDLAKVVIDRGKLIGSEQAADLKNYDRYKITGSGISPRALPFQTPATVVADADEHDEQGHLTEKAELRNSQVAKRLKKMDGIRTEVTLPVDTRVAGGEIVLIGWGSTRGAIEEASVTLRSEGIPVNVLHLSQVWPFPADAVAGVLGTVSRSVAVENNATGQLAELIRAETGIKVSGQILKYDGRPISAKYIVDALAGVM
jgi:2-oxoglutarate/2-oxoacid ferredoxin oxidoreductase subunit alpha